MSVPVTTQQESFPEPGDSIAQARVDLAAAFRWTARLGHNEGVANHFSLAIDEAGSRFLLNPNGRHFSRIRASELLEIDSGDADTSRRPDAPDPSAWAIHGAMHRSRPDARCVLHLHPKHSTVLASLEDSSIPPIDQNTMRFYNRVACDDGFDGMGLGDEAERLPGTLGDKRILVMGNHGIMVVADSVAQAFDDLYYFERACETLVTAYSTGKPLRVVSHEVAEKTARQWENYTGAAELHFGEIKRILDEEEPDYRD